MIKINEPCPEFKLSNHRGDILELQNIKEKISVIFFYPKNFTPGCTKEACSFRDNYSEFINLGCQVIGVSSDNDMSHEKFQKKYSLPYLTFSDENNLFRKSLGLPSNLFGLIPGRVTLIFDKMAVLKGIYNSQLNTQGHIDFALKTVKELI